jgi:hypothetical protein
MASAFRDTLFAYILRSAFGSRVFPHADEKSLPTIWEEKLSTQTSPRDSAHTTLNEEPKPDAASTHSGPTQCGDAPKKVDAEKGDDTLLVEWYGPTDPDVSCHCVCDGRVPLAYKYFDYFRIRRTGRVRRRHG